MLMTIEYYFLGFLFFLFICSFIFKFDFVQILKKSIPAEKYLENPKNVSENKCRRIFERLFGVPFSTIRPNWLKNPETGRNLELDGYNPNIKTKIGKGLAFEYDGVQHYQYNPIFHKKESDFTSQVRRDFFKDKRCKELGIVLIRVPFDTKDMEEYIRKELKNYEPFSILI